MRIVKEGLDGGSEFDDENMSGPDLHRLLSVISSVDVEDFERFDPPADLWSRISESIAAERTPGMVVEYWIDADDIVFATGDGWSEFARNNDAIELIEFPPTTTLWSQFAGDEVRDIWRALIAHVRDRQVETTVPLRCDAPDMRRWLDMTITPGDNDTVRFRSALIFEEQRESVALLESQTDRDRSAAAILLCSWCGRANDQSQWVGIEDLVRGHRLLEQTVVPPISYGICPSCRAVMSAELHATVVSRDTPD